PAVGARRPRGRGAAHRRSAAGHEPVSLSRLVRLGPVHLLHASDSPTSSPAPGGFVVRRSPAFRPPSHPRVPGTCDALFCSLNTGAAASLEENMPEQKPIERARKDAREGKSPSTQAGEFVHEEIEHIRKGKHGAQSAKQAIAIGLSKARRAGVKLPP